MKWEKRKNLQVLGVLLIILSLIFVSGYQGIQNSLFAAPELKPWVYICSEPYWLIIWMPTPRETNQTNFFQTVLSQTTTYNIQPSETMKVIDRYRNVTNIALWDEPRTAEFVATTETVMRIKIDSTLLNLSDPFPISEDLVPKEAEPYIKSEKYTYWEDDHHTKMRILNIIQPDDPAIKSLAKNLSQGCKKEIEVVNKIANWISKNITPADHCLDVKSYNPAWVLENKTARCVGFSNLMIALLRDNNIPARLVYGIKYRKKLVRINPGHCWIEIYFPEVGWLQYDPTYHSPVPFCIPFKVLRDYAEPEHTADLSLRTDFSSRWDTKVQITDLGNNTIKMTYTVFCKTSEDMILWKLQW